MKSVFADIKEDAKDIKLTYEKMGSLIGVNKSQISHYMSGKNHMSFEKFLALVNFLYNDVDKINNYIYRYALNSEKIKDARKCIEYLYNYGRADYVREIISKYSEDSYAIVYRYILARNEREIAPKEFLVQLEKMKYQENLPFDSKTLINTYILFAYIDLKAFSLIPIMGEELLNSIDEKQDNSYILTSHKYKIYETIAYYYLRQNKINEAAELANIVIKNSEHFPLINIYMLGLLSEIYVFISYEKSINYNKLAFTKFNKLGLGMNKRRRIILESTHDFICIYHKKYKNLYLTDDAEKAHYLLSTQEKYNVKKGIEILKVLEKKNKNLSPHQKYYLALGTKNVQLMKEALTSFEKNGDVFYSLLPKNYLIENNPTFSIV